MLLRLRKSFAGAYLLISVYCLPTLGFAEPVIEISYFQEILFKKAPLTFHIKSAPFASISVQTNGVDFVQLPKTSDTLKEFTHVPKGPLQIRFSSSGSAQSWDFTLLVPGFVGSLSEKEGYLYQGEVPVILLPSHLLPPPLDRRWETVDMVKQVLKSDKPSIPSLLTLFSGEGTLQNDFKTIFPSATFTDHPPNTSSWFRVHGYLIGDRSLPSADFVAVEMDLFDLERGMSPKMWFMKWQFLLQHLHQASGYKDGLLIGPVYDQSNRNWQPILETKLKGLALAHGLRFIDRSVDEGVWQERLNNQLQKRYQLP